MRRREGFRPPRPRRSYPLGSHPVLRCLSRKLLLRWCVGCGLNVVCASRQSSTVFGHPVPASLRFVLGRSLGSGVRNSEPIPRDGVSRAHFKPTRESGGVRIRLGHQPSSATACCRTVHGQRTHQPSRSCPRAGRIPDPRPSATASEEPENALPVGSSALTEGLWEAPQGWAGNVDRFLNPQGIPGCPTSPGARRRSVALSR